MLASFRDVGKTYGRVDALRSLSLDIPEGAIGLVGPNGSGKSTLLRLLCGVTRPTSGEVRTLGMDPWEAREELMGQMGVLFDQQGYPSWKTGEEFLLLVAEIKGLKDIAGEVARAAAVIGMSEVLRRPIRTYSAGMKQRIGIAAALLGEPPILVLDEPMANLDPLWRLKFIEVLKHRRASALRGFILSSHFTSDIGQLCEFLVVLNAGGVVAAERLADIGKVAGDTVYRVRIAPLDAFLERLNTVAGIARVETAPATSTVVIHGREGLEEELSRIVRTDGFVLHEFTPAAPSVERYIADLLSQDL
jgi:Cu-processing system ATP-binding protein